MLWVNFYYLNTSAFSLVFKHLYKFAHSNVKATLSKIFIPVHKRQRQVFEHNSIVLPNKAASELVQEICPLIDDVFVELGKPLNSKAPGIAAFLLPGDRTLKNPQFLLSVDVMPGRVKELAVTRCHQVRNAKVDANRLAGRLPVSDEITFKCKTNVPFSIPSQDANLLDNYTIWDFTVPFDANRWAVGENQLAVLDTSTVIGSEDNTVESGCRLESWKTRLFLCFETAEKRFERYIKTAHRLLKRGAVYLRIFGFTNLIEAFALVVERQRQFRFFPGRDPLFKGLIVEAPVAVKHFVQVFPGRLVRIYSELIVAHRLLAFLGLDVLLDCFFGNVTYRAAIVRPGPKSWKPCPKFLELLPENPAGLSLECKSDSSGCPGNIRFDKKVNVVRCDLKSMNDKTTFLSNVVDNFFKAQRNFADQNLPPIFRTPYEMIFD